MPSSRTGDKDVLGSFFAHLAPGHALLKHPQHVYAALEGLSQFNRSLCSHGQFDSLLTSALTFIFTLALFNERGPSSCGLPLLHSLCFSHTGLFVDPCHTRHTPAPGLFPLPETLLSQIPAELIPHPSGLGSNVPYR